MLVVGAVACGGGGAQPQRSTLPIGYADPQTIRALCTKYVPERYAIVTTFEGLPSKFELPDGAYELSTGGDYGGTFDGYLRDGAYEMLVTYTTTAVHELTHAYISRMAYQLLAERQQPRGLGAHAILADGEPWLVPFTATFPSSDLDPTFPDDARTSRYQVYISPGDQVGGTQVEGIYGLLNELTASYQDAHTTLGFWPWVRDEAPRNYRLIMNYAVLLDDLQRAYGDFTLWILHYLHHAREEQPEIYEAVLANEAFRAAFLGVHDAYVALIAKVVELEPEVFAFARTVGVKLERRGRQLLIDGNPQLSGEIDAIRAVRNHLDTDVYRAELEALR